MKKEKNNITSYIFWSTQTTLVILKTFKLISISWWMVFAPVWILVGILVVCLIVVATLSGIEKL